MEPWKKYIVIGLVVAALLLVAVQAAGQGKADIKASSMNAEEWVKRVEDAFGTLDNTQRDSIREIVQAFVIYGDNDGEKLIYILATAWHESKLRPIKEYRAKSGTALYATQNRYWPSGYYGRGFVQLTWESNYRKMGAFLGINLVASPDLALQPKHASRIIVYGMMNGSFTGKSLGQYINLLQADYKNARRVVNGTDKATLIKGYAQQLENKVA